MNNKEIKNYNIKYSLVGFFFISISVVLVDFFLPFFLKERGLNILEIGFLLSVGLALGGFFASILYSKILKKIKLGVGLIYSSVLAFTQNLLIFIIPNNIGVLLSNINNRLLISTSNISMDVTLQHNSQKNQQRKISSFSLVIETFGNLIGLILAVVLINFFGFEVSFLFFAFLAIPSTFFFFRVSDKTRIKIKKRVNLPKTSSRLKLILFSEIIYWFALSSSFALVITFLVTDFFSGSIFEIALLFIALYFSMIITTLLSYRILDKHNLIKTSILGMVILFFSAVLVILSPNIYFVLGAMILEGVGAGIWVPSKEAIYWRLTHKQSREKVSGYLNGWSNLAKALGPLFGGLLVFKLGILIPFYFKAVIAFLIIIIYIYVLKTLTFKN